MQVPFLHRLIAISFTAFLPCHLKAQSVPAITVPIATVPVNTTTYADLSGEVLDSASRQPVEYANVMLRRPSTSMMIASVFTNATGAFTFRNVPSGTYDMIINFVTYKVHKQSLTVNESDVTLAPIMLVVAVRTLKEVIVTADREVIEIKPDRIVYNAEKDITASGGTAADLMRNVPLLSLDAEGNLELRGNRNVRILINNKPSALVAGSVAEALKQIPADQIKSVEVITAPSAKYDGEGTGGVVNINLKRGELEGVSGTATMGIGNRGANTSGAITVRHGKVTVNTSVGATLGSIPANSLLRRSDVLTGGSLGELAQSSQQDTRSQSIVTRAGLDWDISKFHSVNFGAALLRGNNRTESDLINRYDAADALRLDTLFNRAISRNNQSLSYDVSGGYTRTFKQVGREWSVLAQLSNNSSGQYYVLDQFPGWASDGQVRTYQEDNRNRNHSLEATFQTDFVLPIRKTKLESGIKSITRTVRSSSDLYNALADQELILNPSRSNSFEYNQTVASAYFSYTFGNVKKLNYRLGVRTEQTQVEGAFQQLIQSRFTQRYINLLPNAMINYALAPSSWLRLTYNRRIFRPQIQFLNPYVNRADPRNLFFGNPNLQPEFSHSFELSWNNVYKKGTSNISLFALQTNNAVELVRSVTADGVNSTTYLNVGQNGRYGASVFASFRPSAKWNLSVNSSLYEMFLRSTSLQTNVSQLMFTLNANSTIKLPHNFSLQTYGGYNSARRLLQGRSSGFGFYTLGIRKSWLKDRASLVLNTTNFVRATRTLRTTLASDRFSQSGEYTSYIRSVRLSFSYRFGKIDSKPQRSKRGIQNDDTKQSEDSAD